MTFARREEILSKDILRIKDVEELNDMDYQPAAQLIRDIKRVMRSTYNKRGRIATSDYIKFFEGQRPEEEPKVEIKETVFREHRTKTREMPLFRAKDYATK